MNEIRAYYKINESLASSGQPTETQFLNIASAGYEVIINLAMPTSDFAIANEGEIVSSLGLHYVHIPVSWENPETSDLLSFYSAMQAFKNKKVWVHCALNMRASCFIYLYRSCVLQISEPESQFPMSEIWQPSGAWENLISVAKKL